MFWWWTLFSFDILLSLTQRQWRCWWDDSTANCDRGLIESLKCFELWKLPLETFKSYSPFIMTSIKNFSHFTVTAPTTTTWLKRTQRFFFSFAWNCENKKRHTKRNTNLKLNRMNLFSVPRVYKKFGMHIFYSSLFFYCCYCFCAIASIYGRIKKKANPRCDS